MNTLFSYNLLIDESPSDDPLTFIALEDNSSLYLGRTSDTVDISKIEVKVNNR